MRQLAPTPVEVGIWGRILDGYEGAYGTGSRYTDPSGQEVGVDGHLWLMKPIQRWELEAAWRGSGISTDHPQSAWHNLDEYREFKVHLRGYKVKKGLLSGSVWAAALSFMMDQSQVDVGWLSSTDLVSLFKKFDRWIEGQLKPSPNIAEAVSQT